MVRDLQAPIYSLLLINYGFYEITCYKATQHGSAVGLHGVYASWVAPGHSDWPVNLTSYDSITTPWFTLCVYQTQCGLVLELSLINGNSILPIYALPRPL